MIEQGTISQEQGIYRADQGNSVIRHRQVVDEVLVDYKIATIFYWIGYRYAGPPVGFKSRGVDGHPDARAGNESGFEVRVCAKAAESYTHDDSRQSPQKNPLLRESY